MVFIFHPQVGRDVSARINHPCATELLPGSLLLLFAAFSHFACSSSCVPVLVNKPDKLPAQFRLAAARHLPSVENENLWRYMYIDVLHECFISNAVFRVFVLAEN